MRAFLMVLVLLGAGSAGYFGLSGESGGVSLNHEYLLRELSGRHRSLRPFGDEKNPESQRTFREYEQTKKRQQALLSSTLREYEQSEELRQAFLSVALGLLGLTGLCALLLSRLSNLGEAGPKIRRHLGIIALCAAATVFYLDVYPGTWSQLASLERRLDVPIHGNDMYKDVRFIERLQAEQRRLMAFYASLGFTGLALFWTVRLSHQRAPSGGED